jgi:hypothetical protein
MIEEAILVENLNAVLVGRNDEVKKLRRLLRKIERRAH